MIDTKVRATEKQQFKKVIEQSGFDFLSDFIETRDSNSEYALQFRNTPMQIVFKRSPVSFINFKVYITHYTPEYPLKTKHKDYVVLIDTLTALSNWLSEHVKRYVLNQKAEIEWHSDRSFQSGARGFNVTFEDPEMFSEPEKENLKVFLGDFKKDVIDQVKSTPNTTAQLLEERLNHIENGIKYLESKLETSTRFEWISISIGAVQILTSLIGIPSVNLSLVFMDLMIKCLPKIVKIIPELNQTNQI